MLNRVFLLLAGVSLVFAGSMGVNATPAAPGSLTAGVQTGNDGTINLNWAAAAGATGYRIYRLNPTPIQSQATSVTSGSDGAGVSWVNAPNVADGNYGTGAYTNGGANWGPNDWVQINFSSGKTIGAIGLIQALQPAQPNWVRDVSAVDVNGGSLFSGKNILDATLSPGTGRNKYNPLYNPIRTAGGSVLGAPLTNVTSVKVNLSGIQTDGHTAITEVDLWEFQQVADVGSGTLTVQDVGRTVGSNSTYFVTAYDGTGESKLSNVASIRAGDRDKVAAQTSAITGDFQRGTFEGITPRAAVPDAPATVAQLGNLGVQRRTLNFTASPTEGATGDVKQYRLYRSLAGKTTADATEITNPNITLLSKRDGAGGGGYGGPVSNLFDGNPTTAGYQAYNNYSESDEVLSFGSGNNYAVVKMAIHQEDAGASQHCYRNISVEAAGGYITDTNSGTAAVDPIDMTTVNPWTTTRFSTTVDGTGDGVTTGLSTFGFSPLVSGQLPQTWLVGDKLTLHFGNGENSLDLGEIATYGLKIDPLGSPVAVGGSYSFFDSTALNNTIYTYFLVAEDYAGNQSIAAFGTFLIPEPASLGLLAFGALAFVRRPRRACRC